MIKLKAGDVVSVSHDIHHVLGDIAAGTLGIVIWWDNARGHGAVAWAGLGKREFVRIEDLQK